MTDGDKPLSSSQQIAKLRSSIDAIAGIQGLMNDKRILMAVADIKEVKESLESSAASLDEVFVRLEGEYKADLEEVKKLHESAWHESAWHGPAWPLGNIEGKLMGLYELKAAILKEHEKR